MDADTRHQLKQNELAEMLLQVRHKLDDPRARYALLAAGALLVLALVGYLWHRSRQSAAAERSQQLSSIVNEQLRFITPEGLPAAQQQLRNLLTEITEPELAGYTRLQLARTYIEQGLRDPNARPQAFEDAARLLEEVNANPQSTPMLKASASFALASTYESLGQPDKAQELYTRLADPAYAGSPYQQLAAERLSTIDRAALRVTFLPGSAPPETQPAPPAPTTFPAEGAAASAPATLPAATPEQAAPAALPTTAPATAPAPQPPAPPAP
ncbi:MAG: hypothetical protein AB1716_03115 [Planctomycetota bacterium]